MNIKEIMDRAREKVINEYFAAEVSDEVFEQIKTLFFAYSKRERIIISAVVYIYVKRTIDPMISDVTPKMMSIVIRRWMEEEQNTVDQILKEFLKIGNERLEKETNETGFLPVVTQFLQLGEGAQE